MKLEDFNNEKEPHASVHPELMRTLRYLEETDDPGARTKAAEELLAEIDERIREIRESQRELGGQEELDALARSRMTDLARTLITVSRILVAIDAGSWFLSAVASIEISWILLAPACLLIASTLAFSSKLLAKLLLRDSTSVARTQRRHFIAAGYSLGIAALGGLLLAFAAFAPVDLVTWILVLGRLPLILINCGIPGGAGVLGSLGETLLKPREYVRLEAEAYHLEHLRDRIKKYAEPSQPEITRPEKQPRISLFTAIFVSSLMLTATQSLQAQDACGIFVDESASLDSRDREVAIDFLVSTISEYTSLHDCAWVVVGRFSNQGRFTHRRWFRVPLPPFKIDCTQAQPDELDSPPILYRQLTNVQEFRRKEAMESCQKRYLEQQQQYEIETEKFLPDFRNAIEVPVPKTNVGTHISDFIHTITSQHALRSLILVTDGLDTSRKKIPDFVFEELTVLMIIVAPNDEYATMDRVIKAAEAWAMVPGLFVFTTSELRPCFWKELGVASSTAANTPVPVCVQRFD